ncbi:uncharacterized protein LOC118561106 isoform X1 [Fundulus heteroclitus]|uniref:uncharacterized protein LOC118561106 isoform X1 n=1 Tax=Fundulus heteroclitus TaxID=8078 RepID=UPI00165CABE1|nr:uncharacterized protein LOC118561106 isoform X1 [Fundulus heteroclitus]
MKADEGASFLDSSSSWETSSMMEAAVFSPPEVFSLSCVEELNFQRPALTSTPLCSLKHSEVGHQDACCAHCSLSSRTPANIQQKIRALLALAPQTPTPLKISGCQEEGAACSRRTTLTGGERRRHPDSQESSSGSEVQGESLLSSILKGQSGSTSQVQCQQKVQQPASSEGPARCGFVPACDEFECFPIDEQLEVWWDQQQGPTQESPEGTTYRTNPFEVSSELQVVMFGKTEDQASLTQQARLYVEP